MSPTFDTNAAFYCEAEQFRSYLKCPEQCTDCLKDQRGNPQGKEARKEIGLLEQLQQLNDEEIILGYREGGSDPKPPIGKSKSYLHGWLNAQVDAGRMKPSEAMRKLAYEYVRRPR